MQSQSLLTDPAIHADFAKTIRSNENGINPAFINIMLDSFKPIESVTYIWVLTQNSLTKNIDSINFGVENPLEATDAFEEKNQVSLLKIKSTLEKDIKKIKQEPFKSEIDLIQEKPGTIGHKSTPEYKILQHRLDKQHFSTLLEVVNYFESKEFATELSEIFVAHQQTISFELIYNLSLCIAFLRNKISLNEENNSKKNTIHFKSMFFQHDPKHQLTEEPDVGSEELLKA